MSRSFALYSTLILGLLTVAGCSSDYSPCPTPQERRECSCGGDVVGVQQCMPEKVWSDCVCGEPGPADGGAAGASGTRAGAGGMSGAAAGAGGAGASAAGMGGAGGSAGTMAPAAGAGAGGAGGAGGGTGGAGGAAAGTGGAGGASGAMADAKPAYGGCSEDNVEEDCRSGSTCVVTEFGGDDVSVCAPACTTMAQCPVPEGEYEAMVVCTEGRCRIDCTGELLTPLSCPTGMVCADQVIGTSYCHDSA